MVTVVATDSGAPHPSSPPPGTWSSPSPTADDDGVITLSSVQPRVRIPFTATLTDEDGVVAESVKWQWYKAKPGTDGAPRQKNLRRRTDAIAKATSATYTPEGRTLQDWHNPVCVGHLHRQLSVPRRRHGRVGQYGGGEPGEPGPSVRGCHAMAITSTTRDIPGNTLAVSTDERRFRRSLPTNARDNVGTPVKATDANATLTRPIIRRS